MWICAYYAHIMPNAFATYYAGIIGSSLKVILVTTNSIIVHVL